MLSSEDDDRLQAYLAGESTPDEAAAIEQRLKQEPELADALMRLAREDAILADWARVADRTAAVERATSASSTRYLSRRWFALAAAALVAAGATWFVTGLLPRDNSLARVQDVVGDVFLVTGGQRNKIESGCELLSGQGLELEGDLAVAVVVYPDGTRLEFDGDTVVTEFTGGSGTGKRVHLTAGNVRADVAKQPKNLPMVLKTSNAEVTVLGTKFDLSGSAKTTYVETSEGAVRLTRDDDGRAIDVPAGYEGRADSAPDMSRQASPPRFRQPRLTTSGCDRTTVLAPDGATLVTSRFEAGKVTLWNAADGQERLNFTAHAGQIEATAYSPDGKLLATGGLDGKIHLWDANAQPVKTLDAPQHLQALCFSDDGALLFAMARPAQSDLRLYTWDLAKGELTGEPRKLLGELWAFSPHGRTLAVASVKKNNVTLWELANWRQRAETPQLPGRVHAMGMSRDDSQVAVSDKTGRVAVYEIDSGREVQTFFPPGGSAQGLAFSPDGSQLAMGMRYATVRVWDVASGKQRYVLEGTKRPGATASIRPMFFSPDAKTLATTESLGDSLVRLWDLPTN